jgi:hypothetical protein
MQIKKNYMNTIAKKMIGNWDKDHQLTYSYIPNYNKRSLMFKINPKQPIS